MLTATDPITSKTAKIKLFYYRGPTAAH